MSSTLVARAREHRWYHTLELGPDLVTEGWWDHRPVTNRFGLPDRMDGMRALDIGTWDGFWAFEMERRGAEVVALDLDDERDLDWPPRRRPSTYSDEPRGAGFRMAKELLGSRVERVDCSIYDARPGDLGTFDVVFCSTVLLHLRDQFLALERIAALTRGLFISAEEYDLWASLSPWPMSRFLADRDKAVVFWLPGMRTWQRMIAVAGFNDVRRHGHLTLAPRNSGFKVRHVITHARASATCPG